VKATRPNHAALLPHAQTEDKNSTLRARSAEAGWIMIVESGLDSLVACFQLRQLNEILNVPPSLAFRSVG